MARIVNICTDNKKQALDKYENINIVDIENIINHSIDFIKFDYLQFFEYRVGQKILEILINKLKLGGIIVLSISNFKNISRLYADAIISDNIFLEKIYNCQSVWSVELLLDLINTNHTDTNISKIQHDNQHNTTYLTIERKSL
jgi:hypothetical protein